MIKSRLSLFQRLVAFGVGVTFTLTNALLPVPLLEAREVTIPAHELVSTLQIPQEAGIVEEIYAPEKRGQAPFVIHIQTAHGSYEGAKKIEAILRHLTKEYGVHRILLEGAAGRLEPELDRYFRDPELNRQVLEYRAQQGQASGASLFLWEAPAAVEARGIESIPAYRKNRFAFQEVFRLAEDSKNALDPLNREIENLRSALPKPLRDFLTRREAFEAKQISADDWFRYLRKSAQKKLGINLLQPTSQKDWPNLLRLARLQRIENQGEGEKIQKEKRGFLKEVRRFLSAPLLKELSNLLEKQTLPYGHVRFLLERVIDSLPPSYSFDRFPQLKTFLQFLVFRNELQGDSLFAEFDRLSNEIQISLAGDEKSKRVVRLIEDFRLLKQLFSLELTPKDYGRVNESIRPSTLTQQIQLKDSDRKRLDQVFDKALEFYRGAKEREGFMARNIARSIRKTEKPVVVITGGFHTQGLKEFFKSRGLAYALVTPRLSEEGSRQGYLDSILERRPALFAQATVEDALAHTSIPPAILKRLGVDPVIAKELRLRDLLFSKIDLKSHQEEINRSLAARLYGFRFPFRRAEVRTQEKQKTTQPINRLSGFVSDTVLVSDSVETRKYNTTGSYKDQASGGRGSRTQPPKRGLESQPSPSTETVSPSAPTGSLTREEPIKEDNIRQPEIDDKAKPSRAEVRKKDKSQVESLKFKVGPRQLETRNLKLETDFRRRAEVRKDLEASLEELYGLASAEELGLKLGVPKQTARRLFYQRKLQGKFPFYPELVHGKTKRFLNRILRSIEERGGVARPIEIAIDLDVSETTVFPFLKKLESKYLDYVNQVREKRNLSPLSIHYERRHGRQTRRLLNLFAGDLKDLRKGTEAHDILRVANRDFRRAMKKFHSGGKIVVEPPGYRSYRLYTLPRVYAALRKGLSSNGRGPKKDAPKFFEGLLTLIIKTGVSLAERNNGLGKVRYQGPVRPFDRLNEYFQVIIPRALNISGEALSRLDLVTFKLNLDRALNEDFPLVKSIYPLSHRAEARRAASQPRAESLVVAEGGFTRAEVRATPQEAGRKVYLLLEEADREAEVTDQEARKGMPARAALSRLYDFVKKHRAEGVRIKYFIPERFEIGEEDDRDLLGIRRWVPETIEPGEIDTELFQSKRLDFLITELTVGEPLKFRLYVIEGREGAAYEVRFDPVLDKNIENHINPLAQYIQDHLEFFRRIEAPSEQNLREWFQRGAYGKILEVLDVIDQKRASMPGDLETGASVLEPVRRDLSAMYDPAVRAEVRVSFKDIPQAIYDVAIQMTRANVSFPLNYRTLEGANSQVGWVSTTGAKRRTWTNLSDETQRMINLYVDPAGEYKVIREGNSILIIEVKRRAEVRKITFDIDGKYEIVIKQGDLTKEKADGVIVPINTAFAIGGASADVLYTVNQARSKPGQDIYHLLFPSLDIKNPVDLSPWQVILDLEERPKVAETGTATTSKSIQAAGISFKQWDRIIAAFIRNQGEDVSKKDLQNATLNAIILAEKSRLESVAMVPFGTGLFGIPAQRSASLMIPVILQYLRSKNPKHLKKITFVMNIEGQYEKFVQAARKLLRAEVRNPQDERSKKEGERNRIGNYESSFNLPWISEGFVSRINDSIRAITFAIVGGKTRRQTMPAVSAGGYLRSSVKSLSWVSSTLFSSLANLNTAPFFNPFGHFIISQPLARKEAASFSWIISSVRNRNWLLGGVGMEAAFAVHELARQMQRSLNVLLGQRGITFEDIFQRITAFQHMEDKRDRDAGAFETRLPMADIRRDADISSNIGSHREKFITVILLGQVGLPMACVLFGGFALSKFSKVSARGVEINLSRAEVRSEMEYRAAGFAIWYFQSEGVNFKRDLQDVSQAISLSFFEERQKRRLRGQNEALSEGDLRRIALRTVGKLVWNYKKYRLALAKLRRGKAEEINLDTFPGRLVWLIKYNKWSEAEFGRKMGIRRRNTVYSWTKGKKFPSPARMKQMADLLETTVSWIMTGILREDLLNIQIEDEYSPQYRKLLGLKVRVLRYERGKTGLELARELGVLVSSLASWENGVYLPSPHSMQLLAKELDTTVSQLLVGMPEENLMQTDFRNRKQLGLKIKILRYKKGWTMSRLAKEAGVSIPTVYRWETGVKIPSPPHMKKLAERLDISVSEMMAGMREDQLLNLEIDNRRDRESRKRLGLKIKILRYKKGWSVETLGAQIGTSRHQTIDDWEQGRRFPSRRYLLEISRIFGVDLSQLVTQQRTTPRAEVRRNRISSFVYRKSKEGQVPSDEIRSAKYASRPFGRAEVRSEEEKVRAIWEGKTEPVWGENFGIDEVKAVMELYREERKKIKKKSIEQLGSQRNDIFLRAILNAAERSGKFPHLDFAFLKKAYHSSHWKGTALIEEFVGSLPENSRKDFLDSIRFAYRIISLVEGHGFRHFRRYGIDPNYLFTLFELAIMSAYHTYRNQWPEFAPIMSEIAFMNDINLLLSEFWEGFDAGVFETITASGRLALFGIFDRYEKFHSEYPFYFNILHAQIKRLAEVGSEKAQRLLRESPLKPIPGAENPRKDIDLQPYFDQQLQEFAEEFLKRLLVEQADFTRVHRGHLLSYFLRELREVGMGPAEASDFLRKNPKARALLLRHLIVAGVLAPEGKWQVENLRLRAGEFSDQVILDLAKIDKESEKIYQEVITGKVDTLSWLSLGAGISLILVASLGLGAMAIPLWFWFAFPLSGFLVAYLWLLRENEALRSEGETKQIKEIQVQEDVGYAPDSNHPDREVVARVIAKEEKRSTLTLEYSDADHQKQIRTVKAGRVRVFPRSLQPPSPRAEVRRGEKQGGYEINQSSRAEVRSRVVALADDVTGRREIEGGLRQAGFQVEGFSQPGDLAELRPDHVAVVNLGTRHMDPKDVINHLEREWNDPSLYERQILDLKIDSKMRGPMGALIREIAERHKSDLIVFTPLNPRQGQAVIGGKLYVTENGKRVPLNESSYWDEILKPEYSTASLAEILARQAAASAGHIHEVPLETVRKEDGGLKEYFSIQGRGSQLLIFDAETEEDLEKIIRATENLGRRILRVGSAGLLNAAHKRMTPENPVPEKDRNLPMPFRPARGGAVVLATTLNPVTRRQMEKAEEIHGKKIRRIELDPSKLTGSPEEQKAEQDRAKGLMRNWLEDGFGIILTTNASRLAADWSRAQRTNLEKVIAREAAAVLNDKEILSHVKYVFASGGDAAEALEEVFHTHADVLGLLAQDTPWGILQRGPPRGIPMVTKSGGFGADDSTLIARFFDESFRPNLAVSLGDPLGIGPEIAVRLFLEHPEILTHSNPVIVGNSRIVQEALEFVRGHVNPELDPEKKWTVKKFGRISDVSIPRNAEGNPLPVIPVLEIPNPTDDAARLVEDILAKTSELARAGWIDGWVRNPINKGRIDRARLARKDPRKFIGHTEFLEEEIGTEPPILKLEDQEIQKELAATRMILTHGSEKSGVRLSVIHASKVHQSLREAVEEFVSPDEKVRQITIAKTAEVILRAARFVREKEGIARPRIAVNDLTPQQEITGEEIARARGVLRKAIALAKKFDSEIEVEGPLAARESYSRALFGDFDFVVALYHDQGHIPLKLASSLLDNDKIIPADELARIRQGFKTPQWDPREGVFHFGNLDVYLASPYPPSMAVRNYQSKDSQDTLFSAIAAARRDLKQKGISNPRILVAAVNPHAGEGGKFGREDQESSLPAVRRAREAFPDTEISDPFSADGVLIEALVKRWNAVIMLHQDQAETAAAIYKTLEAQGRLLPEPTIAGVNVTEGIKEGFVSTAVDHGTDEPDAWNKDRKHAVVASSLFEAYTEALHYILKGREAKLRKLASRAEVRALEVIQEKGVVKLKSGNQAVELSGDPAKHARQINTIFSKRPDIHAESSARGATYVVARQNIVVDTGAPDFAQKLIKIILQINPEIKKLRETKDAHGEVNGIEVTTVNDVLLKFPLSAKKFVQNLPTFLVVSNLSPDEVKTEEQGNRLIIRLLKEKRYEANLVSPDNVVRELSFALRRAGLLALPSIRAEVRVQSVESLYRSIQPLNLSEKSEEEVALFVSRAVDTLYPLKERLTYLKALARRVNIDDEFVLSALEDEEKFHQLFLFIHPYRTKARRELEKYVTLFNEHEGAYFILQALTDAGKRPDSLVVVNVDPHDDIPHAFNFGQPVVASSWGEAILEDRLASIYIQIGLDDAEGRPTIWATRYHSGGALTTTQISPEELIDLLKNHSSLLTVDADSFSLKERIQIHPGKSTVVTRYHYEIEEVLQRMARINGYFEQAGNKPIRVVLANSVNFLSPRALLSNWGDRWSQALTRFFASSKDEIFPLERSVSRPTDTLFIESPSKEERSNVLRLYQESGTSLVPFSVGSQGYYAATPEAYLGPILQAFDIPSSGIFTIIFAGSGQGRFELSSALKIWQQNPEVQIIGIESNPRLYKDSQKVLKAARRKGLVKYPSYLFNQPIPRIIFILLRGVQSLLRILMPFSKIEWVKGETKNQLRFFKGDFNSPKFRKFFKKADGVYYGEEGTFDINALTRTLTQNLRPGGKVVTLGQEVPAQAMLPLGSTGAFEVSISERVPQVTTYTRRAEVRAKSQLEELSDRKLTLASQIESLEERLESERKRSGFAALEEVRNLENEIEKKSAQLVGAESQLRILTEKPFRPEVVEREERSELRMLVLSRKKGQQIAIGENRQIVITAGRIEGDSAWIKITAAPNITIRNSGSIGPLKVGAKVIINEQITVMVTEIDRGKIRLGFEAPKEVPILRTELLKPTEPGPVHRLKDVGKLRILSLDRLLELVKESGLEGKVTISQWPPRRAGEQEVIDFRVSIKSQADLKTGLQKLRATVKEEWPNYHVNPLLQDHPHAPTIFSMDIKHRAEVRKVTGRQEKEEISGSVVSVEEADRGQKGQRWSGRLSPAQGNRWAWLQASPLSWSPSPSGVIHQPNPSINANRIQAAMRSLRENLAKNSVVIEIGTRSVNTLRKVLLNAWRLFVPNKDLIGFVYNVINSLNIVNIFFPPPIRLTNAVISGRAEVRTTGQTTEEIFAPIRLRFLMDSLTEQERNRLYLAARETVASPSRKAEKILQVVKTFAAYDLLVSDEKEALELEIRRDPKEASALIKKLIEKTPEGKIDWQETSIYGTEIPQLLLEIKKLSPILVPELRDGFEAIFEKVMIEGETSIQEDGLNTLRAAFRQLFYSPLKFSVSEIKHSFPKLLPEDLSNEQRLSISDVEGFLLNQEEQDLKRLPKNLQIKRQILRQQVELPLFAYLPDLRDPQALWSPFQIGLLQSVADRYSKSFPLERISGEMRYERIRRLRTLFELEPAIVARATDVSEKVYRTWETKSGKPEPESLRKLATFYTSRYKLSFIETAKFLGMEEIPEVIERLRGRPAFEVLKGLRESRWLLQDEVAKALDPGLSAKTYGRWELAKSLETGISRKWLWKAAAYYHREHNFPAAEVYGLFELELQGPVVSKFQGADLPEIYQGLQNATGAFEKEIAEAAEVNLSTYQRWKSRQHPPARDGARKILDYYVQKFEFPLEPTYPLFGFETPAQILLKIRDLPLHEVLKVLRNWIGFSKTQMAKAFGITVHTYIKWERGIGKRSTAELRRIADFYADQYGIEKLRLFKIFGFETPRQLLRRLENEVEAKTTQEEKFILILKTLREYAGKTQTEISNHLEISHGPVAQWEVRGNVPLWARLKLRDYYARQFGFPRLWLALLFKIKSPLEVLDELKDLTFPEALKELRLSQGLIQEEFAVETGVKYRAYQPWEQGNKIPRDKNLTAIIENYVAKHQFPRERLSSLLREKRNSFRMTRAEVRELRKLEEGEGEGGRKNKEFIHAIDSPLQASRFGLQAGAEGASRRAEVRKQSLKDFIAISPENHDAAHQHGIFNRFQQIAYGLSNVSGNGRMDLDQNNSRRGGGEEIQKVAVSSNQNRLLSVGHPEDFAVSRARRDTGNLVPRRTEKPLGMARHIFVKKESQLFGEGDKVAVFQLLGHEMEGGSDMLPRKLGIVVGRDDLLGRNAGLKELKDQVDHDPGRLSVDSEARLPVADGGVDRYVFFSQAIHDKPKTNIGPDLSQAQPSASRAEVQKGKASAIQGMMANPSFWISTNFSLQALGVSWARKLLRPRETSSDQVGWMRTSKTPSVPEGDRAAKSWSWVIMADRSLIAKARRSLSAVPWGNRTASWPRDFTKSSRGVETFSSRMNFTPVELYFLGLAEGDVIEILRDLSGIMESRADVLTRQIGIMPEDIIVTGPILEQLQDQIDHDSGGLPINLETRFPPANPWDDRYIFFDQGIIHDKSKPNTGTGIGQGAPRAEVRESKVSSFKSRVSGSAQLETLNSQLETSGPAEVRKEKATRLRKVEQELVQERPAFYRTSWKTIYRLANDHLDKIFRFEDYQILKNHLAILPEHIRSLVELPQAEAALPQGSFGPFARQAGILMGGEEATVKGKVGWLVSAEIFESYAPILAALQAMDPGLYLAVLAKEKGEREISVLRQAAIELNRFSQKEAAPKKEIIIYRDPIAAVNFAKKFSTLVGVGLTEDDARLISRWANTSVVQKPESHLSSMVAAKPELGELLAKFSAQFAHALESAA